jgi:glutaminyl-tRNA synthetase
MTEEKEKSQERIPANFLEQIVEEDITSGKNGGRVHTRFPRELTVICTLVMPNLFA